VQEAAMASPEAVDEDTEELLAWYYAEIIRRERNDEPVAATTGDGGKRPRGRPRKQHDDGMQHAAPGWNKRPNGRAVEA
jgi:AT hook motif